MERFFEHSILIEDNDLFNFLGWSSKAIDLTNEWKEKIPSRELAKKIFHFDIERALGDIEKLKKGSVTLELFKQYLEFLKDNFPGEEKVKDILNIKHKSNTEIRMSKQRGIKVVRENTNDDLKIPRISNLPSM
jgi:hypothetical protein